jgi:hypothetical protein
MINLVEIIQNQEGFLLREVVVNPSHVISITPDVDAAALHANGKLPTGLHPAQQFSKVVLAEGRSMRVVGNPNMVGDKAKKLLFG